MLIGRILNLSLLFVAALSLAALADDGAKGPKMQFVETSYDFGTAVQGTRVKHAFKFKNIGTDTLRISQVKTSCGCTAAYEGSRVIAPQKEGLIEVELNTASKLGDTSSTVYVISNDAESPKRSIVLRGKVEAKAAEEEKKQ
jgi:hypothetical protein